MGRRQNRESGCPVEDHRDYDIAPYETLLRAAAPGEGGAEAAAGGGVFGMAKGALDSSMQSMGIGKEEEELVRGTATGPRTCESNSDSLPHRLCSMDLCEVFSPPRVGKEATKFGMKAGDAMDLTTGGDFNIPEHRREAEKYVDREKPLVLIGSPPCVAFSQLQTLIPESQRKANQLAEGIRHMDFMVKLYRKQVEGDRVFIHENPAHAKSWALPGIKKMMRELGVDVIETDQCMFGLKTWGLLRPN